MAEPVAAGFTQEDRDRLITLLAKFDSFQSSSERRLEILERERAQKDDLNRVEKELRLLLAQKADKNEVPTSIVNDLRREVKGLHTEVTWAYGFGACAAAVCSAITYGLMAFLHH